MSNFLNILKGNCPNCSKAHIFKTNGNPLLFKIPTMKDTCDNCNYSYHRETGFYFGAMYVSYGFVVIQLIIAMLVGFAFSLSYMDVFLITIVLTFLLWTTNYKYARIVWLYIFK